jgi:thioredoxin
MQKLSAREHGTGLLVVCFCAAWCDTCDGVRAALERIAARDAASTYVWLDIEDDATLVGDIEIENFPTLAVYRDGNPLFFGVSPPQEGVIARTLAAFASADAKFVEVPEAVAELGARLQRSDGR